MFFGLFLTPCALSAQTVSTGAVSSTSICNGSSITIDYTASGSFGTKNVFTVQLSGPDGSFSPTFTNVGQVKSTTTGSITATINAAPGNHYRLRVTSSNPYVVGNNNGSDITIGDIPQVRCDLGSYVYRSAYLVGDTVRFVPEVYNGVQGCTYAWNLGDGASPATSTDSAVSVVYNSTGQKKISITAASPVGCAGSNADSNAYINVYDCFPAIPSDVYIDSIDASADYHATNFPNQHDIWVVPGGKLYAGAYGGRTIYAEAGSTIINPSNNVIYLKDGATVTGGSGVIIHSPGAGMSGLQYSQALGCSSLSFDYTNAPPYKIMAAGVSGSESASRSLIYPNPATGIVTIDVPENPSSITLRNDLGATVWHDDARIANHIQFDVSKYSAGVYYVDLHFSNRVSTLRFSVVR